MTINPIYIRLASHPYRQRSGLMPMICAIATGWIFVGLWGWVVSISLAYNHLWALLVSLSTIAFAVILACMTISIVREARREYTYELNSTEAILEVSDKVTKKKQTIMILLDDVQYAEYYPYTDTSSVILHAPESEMEIPLWPLGRQAQDVLDFLIGRGIKIMNVQMDDKVPV